MNHPSLSYLARIHGAIARAGGGPVDAPFPGMMAANNPNAAPGAPSPVLPPPAAPFPAMLARPPVTEEEALRAGMTPDQARLIGYVPPTASTSTPLVTSAQRAGIAPLTEAQKAGGATAPAAATSAGPPPATASYAQRVADAAFPLTRAPGSGAIVNLPAKETEMRGPTLRAAENEANHIAARTIEHTEARGIARAEVDATNAHMQMADAHAREDAIMESAAQREQELQQRQADFDSSVKALSKMSVDPGRFWASRSTGQKIAGVIALTLGGFMQGVRGGANPGADLINTAIDRDIHAQEMAWHVARDSAAAKQSAFGLAMQKYQNVDAARAAARAAALDAVSAQTNAQQAAWKGVDVSNHADAMRMALGEQYMNQIRQGIAYTPARAVQAPTQFVDPRTGIVRNTAQAIEYEKEMNAAGNQVALKQIEGENQLRGDFAKAAIASGKEKDEGAKFIATQLNERGVPQARTAAEQALAALRRSPGGSGDVAARWALGGGGFANKVMPDESNEREQKYWAFANAAMKAMMGNVTESEFSRAEKQLGNASDPASRERAIDSALETLDAIEKNTKAGASPAAQHEFESRRGAATGHAPVTPNGAQQGWGGARAQGGPVDGGGSYLERVQRAMKKRAA